MSNSRYPIPAATVRVEEEYSRSRFVTTLGHAPSVEAARAFIAAVAGEFGDASHNCWAYMVGAPASTAQNGMSDDGEPHGTAGRPMLTVLLHSGIGEIVVVVTRYFGGTLLGKGGLVKAYSGGVQLALQKVATIERVPKATVEAVFDYAALSLVRRRLPDFEAVVLAEVFAQDVSMRIEVPEANRSSLVAAIVEITNGQAIVE